MPTYAPPPLSSELGEAKIVPVADELAPHGGMGGSGVSGHGSEIIADHAQPAAATGEPLLVAFNPTGELLDLGMTLDVGDTLQNLLGRVGDGLDGLPLVGGVLESVVDTLSTTTGTLLSASSPATSLLGLSDGHEDAAGTGIGSPGHISFAFGTPSEPSALTTAAGGYTGYGISLNLGRQASDFGNDAGIEGSPAASGLDLLDHLPGVDHGSSSDALHLDQSLLRTASDVLA
jgi:hypothetical protein